MKFFIYSLEKDFRAWYKTLPHGNISSLKRFHITSSYFCKRLYPPDSLLEDCCEKFNIENISKIHDVVEDICGANSRKT